MKDLCTRLNPVAFNVDERNLVEFGILEGFIRRIYKVSFTNWIKYSPSY